MSERRHGKTEVMTHDEMEHLLKKSSYGRLGVSFQNETYIVPVSCGYDQGRIFFHSGKRGKKVDFIKRNNRVCFEVDEREGGKAGGSWASVICYGTATLRDDIEAKRGFYDAFRGQTPSDEELEKIETYIGVIQIEEMTGKYRPGPSTAPMSRMKAED